MNQVIPRSLLQELGVVKPSRDGELRYYPCRVHLRSGSVVDRVYLIEAAAFLRIWGDIERPTVPLEDVTRIEESPDRLPPDIANQIYDGGESGMGYCIFTLEFRHGTAQSYSTGNAVDFVRLPEGKQAGDIATARPHVGRNRPLLEGLSYSWCLFQYPA